MFQYLLTYFCSETDHTLNDDPKSKYVSVFSRSVCIGALVSSRPLVKFPFSYIT